MELTAQRNNSGGLIRIVSTHSQNSSSINKLIYFLLIIHKNKLLAPGVVVGEAYQMLLSLCNAFTDVEILF